MQPFKGHFVSTEGASVAFCSLQFTSERFKGRFDICTLEEQRSEHASSSSSSSSAPGGTLLRLLALVQFCME